MHGAPGDIDTAWVADGMSNVYSIRYGVDPLIKILDCSVEAPVQCLN